MDQMMMTIKRAEHFTLDKSINTYIKRLTRTRKRRSLLANNAQ
jgi:hypothetical protein